MHPRAEGAPRRSQVMLVQDPRRGPEVWEGFTQQLSSAGYEVIIVDPRGTAAAALSDLVRPLFQPQPERLSAIIGEGDGALAALKTAADEPSIGAAVLLSPPLESHGLDGLGTMRDFIHCPVLLMATEDDLKASTAAMQYKDAAPAFCEVQLFPGNAHGADIFALKPGAMPAVLDWLRLILDKPVDPAAGAQ